MKIDLRDPSTKVKIAQIGMRNRIFEHGGELYTVCPEIPGTFFIEPGGDREHEESGPRDESPFVFVWMFSARGPRPRYLLTFRNVLTGEKRRLATDDVTVFELGTEGDEQPNNDRQAREWVLQWYADYGTPEEQTWAKTVTEGKKRSTKGRAPTATEPNIIEEYNYETTD